MRSSPAHAAALVPALALSLLLGLGSLAAAQEASPAPSPSPAAVEPVPEGVAEREALRQAREALHEARRAARETRRQERSAEREERQERRRAERDQRRSDRSERQAGPRAAWRACSASVRESMRESTYDTIADVRQAWRDAWAACLADDDALSDGSGSADASGVIRTALGVAEPGSAPGEELGLWHYRIAPGAVLPAHTHPGWQLARITSGQLEYTVLEGEGTVLRADGSSEPMGPGTYVLATGDGVIENPELVHEAANRTRRPVTLISATLFEAGAPVASLVEAAPTTSPAAVEASPAPASPTPSASPAPA
jgi:quercetin dioxygenase-like cupin family protein